jgi:hypothetical protein
MSRTDAHAPHWVTAEWYEPDHYRCQNGEHSLRWWNRNGARECDLPDEPVRHRHVLSGWRSTREHHCTWEPDWTGVSPYSRPRRWFIEHYWHNPERVRSRDTLRAAVADYRANGDTDVQPDARQARHSAGWAWS